MLLTEVNYIPAPPAYNPEPGESQAVQKLPQDFKCGDVQGVCVQFNFRVKIWLVLRNDYF